MKEVDKHFSGAALGSALWWATEHLLDKYVSHMMEAAIRIFDYLRN